MTLVEKILKEATNRFKFAMPIPDDVQAIAKIFHSNGFELYVVGGAVRDALMKKKIKDYDLATDAVPDTVEAILAKAGYKTVPTGKAFGVINVFTANDQYEIATFREDVGSSDSRRPDSVKFTSIDVDVSRRDLTINALFYDINSGEVVDLVGGVDDLKNGRIRTVGQATARFGEDRLRILRAIRFAARIGSELDPEIDATLKENSSLAKVSPERIRDEFFVKSIPSAKDVNYLLSLYSKYTLWKDVFPGLNVVTPKLSTNDNVVVLATILRTNPVDTINKRLNKLTYTVNEIKAITFLNKLFGLNVNNAFLLKKAEKNSYVSKQQIMSFTSINGLNEKLITAFLKFDLTVNGNDVMSSTGLKDAALGNEILRQETENFKRLL